MVTFEEYQKRCDAIYNTDIDAAVAELMATTTQCIEKFQTSFQYRTVGYSKEDMRKILNIYLNKLAEYGWTAKISTYNNFLNEVKLYGLGV